MGLLLAKFRKEKTTEELLEQLDVRIQTLESYMHNTEEQKKRFVGNFLGFSIGIYVLSFVIVYFRYFPTTWKEVLLYFVPLLLVPFVIFRLRRVFTWYFQRKLNKNSDELITLRAEKRKILEQVMDKETYKVAVKLLGRFGDKSTNIKPAFGLTPRVSTAVTPIQTTTVNTLRMRNTPVVPNTSAQFANMRNLNSSNLMSTPSRSNISPTLFASPESAETTRMMASTSALLTHSSTLTRSYAANQTMRRSTPFPIINQQDKSVFERIVDVLIGDGPQDRFAMICKECCAHNGMAPKDEFEYAAFRCAFCDAMNPARKERPIAPRLSTNADARRKSTDTSSSSSDEENSVLPRASECKTSELSDKSASDKELLIDETSAHELSLDSFTTDESSDRSPQLLENNNSQKRETSPEQSNNSLEDLQIKSNILDELKKEK